MSVRETEKFWDSETTKGGIFPALKRFLSSSILWPVQKKKQHKRKDLRRTNWEKSRADETKTAKLSQKVHAQVLLSISLLFSAALYPMCIHSMLVVSLSAFETFQRRERLVWTTLKCRVSVQRSQSGDWTIVIERALESNEAGFRFAVRALSSLFLFNCCLISHLSFLQNRILSQDGLRQWMRKVIRNL